MYWKCSLQALILALVVQTTAAGRQIEDWPFKKLFKEADLVVIATVISNSEAGDQVNDKAPDKKFLGILTTFQVESTLKGDVELKKIVVFHYILKLRDGESISNGPLLVSFHEKPIAPGTEF